METSGDSGLDTLPDLDWMCDSMVYAVPDGVDGLKKKLAPGEADEGMFKCNEEFGEGGGRATTCGVVDLKPDVEGNTNVASEAAVASPLGDSMLTYWVNGRGGGLLGLGPSDRRRRPL